MSLTRSSPYNPSEQMTEAKTRSSYLPLLLIVIGLVVCVAVVTWLPLVKCAGCLGLGGVTLEEHCITLTRDAGLGVHLAWDISWEEYRDWAGDAALWSIRDFAGGERPSRKECPRCDGLGRRPLVKGRREAGEKLWLRGLTSEPLSGEVVRLIRERRRGGDSDAPQPPSLLRPPPSAPGRSPDPRP